MISATRNGHTFRPGDIGFESVWAANMEDALQAHRDACLAKHAERMQSDPVYRAKQEAFAAEYAQAFREVGDIFPNTIRGDLQRWSDLWPALRCVLAGWLLMLAGAAMPKDWRNVDQSIYDMERAMKRLDWR